VGFGKHQINGAALLPGLRSSPQLVWISLCETDYRMSQAPAHKGKAALAQKMTNAFFLLFSIGYEIIIIVNRVMKIFL
jgi:hypothetical protein